MYLLIAWSKINIILKRILHFSCPFSSMSLEFLFQKNSFQQFFFLNLVHCAYLGKKACRGSFHQKIEWLLFFQTHHLMLIGETSKQNKVLEHSFSGPSSVKTEFMCARLFCMNFYNSISSLNPNKNKPGTYYYST